MEKLLNTCAAWLEAGTPLALALIVERHGPAPRGAGTMMAVRGDRTIAGTVGGGLLEARAVEAGLRVLETGGGAMLPFDLTSTDAAQSGMICGGSGRMIVLRVLPGDLPVLAAARDAALSGGRGALEIQWGPDGAAPWTLSFAEEAGQEGLRALPGGGEGYLLPVRSGGRLLIFGAGHVSREIAVLAVRLGFRVTVLDDRTEFASAARFPGCTVEVLPDLDHPPARTLSGDDSVIIATRGHLHDLNCLAWTLRTGAGYVGMIGSRRKKGLVFAALEAQGIPRTALEQVHTPIGLDIQAQTPEEIAVSIAAELIQCRAARRGG